MRAILTTVAAAGAFLIAAGSSMANPIGLTYAGDIAFLDKADSGRNVAVTMNLANPTSPNFSTDLTVGMEHDLGNLFSLTTTVATGGTYRFIDDIVVTFTFTQPPGGTGTVTATDTGSIRGNNLGAIDISWNNPTFVSFSDGSILSIALQTIDPPGSYRQQTDLIDVKFTLTQGPTAVPEPLTLAVLGTGLIGLGMVRRRQTPKT